MNTNTTMRIIGTATAAAICVTGTWAATPAQATTDTTGGSNISNSSSEDDFGQVLAVRKADMAHDHVANPAAPTGFAARTATTSSVCGQQ